ncbi:MULTISPECIES: PKD domain-containing protein [unclassified Methanoregula]|uniref:PKD domain-containing protein n=1 Tax=unclassified Methanoregula TaxID=2649730 RepID=UPI0009CEDF9A|nr:MULTISPECIES: PKD domain-containing protein [unclassified Methanoregula]OPX62868.1 MAG: PKD domain protein [Methanoregula sp. PtaB.Bin085]OPY35305.1 MAG: PKD domain protein [Methanoregula sp. PtaU1.Bin006]
MSRSGPAPLAVTFTDTSTGTITDRSWSFGDGNTSTDQNPSHIYVAAGNYTVNLTAANAAGSNTTVKEGYIQVEGSGPVVDFTATPVNGPAPLTVQFADFSVKDPISWSWDFGDDTHSTTQNPLHIYWNPGIYTVNLSVTNASGSNTTSKENFVTVAVAVYNASNYDFNIENEPEVANDIRTSDIASIAGQYQSTLGYNENSYTNSNVSFAFERMKNDQIFYFAGHGSAGLIDFGNRDGTCGLISANFGQCGKRILNMNNGELDDLLLAVYSGCETGNTSNPITGDLIQTSIDKGVDTAIGFRDDVLDNQQRTWGGYFWYYLLDQKVPVISAATLARVSTINYWGDAGGMDSYRIEGDQNLVIDYAKSGTTPTPTPTVSPTEGGS